FSPGPLGLSTRLESTSRLIGSASDLVRTSFESKSLRRGPPAGREKPAPRIRVVSPGIASQYTLFTEISPGTKGGGRKTVGSTRPLRTQRYAWIVAHLGRDPRAERRLIGDHELAGGTWSRSSRAGT